MEKSAQFAPLPYPNQKRCGGESDKTTDKSADTSNLTRDWPLHSWHRLMRPTSRIRVTATAE